MTPPDPVHLSLSALIDSVFTAGPPSLGFASRPGASSVAEVRKAVAALAKHPSLPRSPGRDGLTLLEGAAPLWHDHWEEAHETAQAREGRGETPKLRLDQALFRGPLFRTHARGPPFTRVVARRLRLRGQAPGGEAGPGTGNPPARPSRRITGAGGVDIAIVLNPVNGPDGNGRRLQAFPPIPRVPSGVEYFHCRPSFRKYLQLKPTYERWLKMLNAAVLFLIIALVAAVLGFGGIAGTAAGIAKILFFVFLVLALISFLTGRRGTTI